jgi:hypothetical protein
MIAWISARRRDLVASAVWRSLRNCTQRHRRAVAACISICAHLLVIFALISNVSRNSPAGEGGTHGKLGDRGDGSGGSDTYVVEVVPVQLASATPVKAQPKETPSDVITPVKIEDLTDVSLDKATNPKLQQATPPELLPVSDPPAPNNSTAASKTGDHAGKEGGTAGDLWSAIEPCWRRVADKDTLPVVLEVTFSGDGHLAIPPTIDRDPAAATDPRTLQSEAKALAALSECGAYPVAAGKAGVKVNFLKPD